MTSSILKLLQYEAKPGVRLEVILKKGVEWYNPFFQADPEGIVATENLKNEPGEEVLGYLSRIDDAQRLFLSVSKSNEIWREVDIPSFYIEEECIYTIHIIIPSVHNR